MSNSPVTSINAKKRGTTRFLTGSTPNTCNASSSSRILRAPKSAVIAVPATPANTIEELRNELAAIRIRRTQGRDHRLARQDHHVADLFKQVLGRQERSIGDASDHHLPPLLMCSESQTEALHSLCHGTGSCQTGTVALRRRLTLPQQPVNRAL